MMAGPTTLRLSARELSAGGVAGTVVGSVVGTLLLLLALPFVVRAWRGSRARRSGKLDAEADHLAQATAGGPMSQPSYPYQRPHSAVDSPSSWPQTLRHGQLGHNGVLVPPNALDPEKRRYGLPSPVSPSLAVAEFGPAQPVVISAAGHQRDLSRSTIFADAGRWSYTPGRISGEPASLADDQSTAGHHRNRHRRPSFKDAIHRIIHLRSFHRPKESSSGPASEGHKSPIILSSINTRDAGACTESTPDADVVGSRSFEAEAVDTEIRGAAWYYYHPDETEPERPQEPLSPPSEQLPLVEEPESIDPDGDKPVSPSRPSSKPFSRLRKPQRMDSQGPQDIVSDIPSPPSQRDHLPSANPMQLMNPTTATEHRWHVNQEIHKIDNSPSPPRPFEAVDLVQPPPLGIVDQTASPIFHQEITHQQMQYTQTITPPEPPSQNAMIEVTVTDVDMTNAVAPSFMAPLYSITTPPPSATSPDTTLSNSDYTPSPPSAIQPASYGPLQTYVQQLQQQQPEHTLQEDYAPRKDYQPQAQYTPHPDYVQQSEFQPSIQPPLHAAYPAQTGHDFSTHQYQMAGSEELYEGQLDPRAFACEECGRVFEHVHKLNHHKRYHERPHTCPHPNCDKRFGTKTHLDRHINDKHNKTRKYYCMVAGCQWSRQGGRAFPRKDNWRRHMINKHSITPASEPDAVYVEDDTSMG